MRELEHALADPDRHDDAIEKYGRIAEQFEHAGGYTFESRIQQVLSGVGFDQADLETAGQHLERRTENARPAGPIDPPAT